VANYPPFACWSPAHAAAAREVLARPPARDTVLGLYLHIPFCRRRCHFCYYKVYVDKTASEVRSYVDGLLAELALYAPLPFVDGRRPAFVYFGGGTPSYLSVEQLTALIEGIRRLLPLDAAEEITFEAEPGTLTEAKLRAIRALGVTRLSLGIEHFDDHILEVNGRAHRGAEIGRAYAAARAAGFPQINVDLIAGMVGDTDGAWTECVRRTLALAPESVTVYQMEIPFNTTIYHEMKVAGRAIAPVADWPTKRRWVGEAFAAFEAAGYSVASGYTVVKDPAKTRFLYRDRLWSGADMIGLGVSSFSHVGGTHFQNEKEERPYLARVAAGELPIHRAYTLDREELMTRELILSLKLGRVDARQIRTKYGVDPITRFAAALARLTERGLARVEGEEIRLTRAGLLCVDELLPDFFLGRHRKPEGAADRPGSDGRPEA
ncbi:MAG: coproporphyrinogen III oxidase family protein, partial [Planctomycetes bacterium]|nr:coproporphyrinogen III oxidase family protein [Planctomycetota bacterium]